MSATEVAETTCANAAVGGRPARPSSRPCSLHKRKRIEGFLPVEQIRKRVADQRCSGLGSEAAMLNDRRGSEARILNGSKSNEQRVIAHFPVQAFVRDHAARSLGHGDAPHLRRAGLAGHLHIIERKLRRGGRAVIDHAAHCPPDEFEMLRIEPEFRSGLIGSLARRRGLIARPLASLAAATASCMGLISTLPWPMDMLIVS